MPEARIIKDDPAAVLRALADGHRVGHPDGTFGLKILPDGALVSWAGSRVFGYISFGGTWHVLPKRDMGTEPKPGDVAQWGNQRIVVDAVTMKGVMYRWPGDTVGCLNRAAWANYFGCGTVTPVEYADD